MDEKDDETQNVRTIENEGGIDLPRKKQYLTQVGADIKRKMEQIPTESSASNEIIDNDDGVECKEDGDIIVETGNEYMNLRNIENLNKFQKEAIWRQLQHYKRRCDDFKNEYNRVLSDRDFYFKEFSTHRLLQEMIYDELKMIKSLIREKSGIVEDIAVESNNDLIEGIREYFKIIQAFFKYIPSDIFNVQDYTKMINLREHNKELDLISLKSQDELISNELKELKEKYYEMEGKYYSSLRKIDRLKVHSQTNGCIKGVKEDEDNNNFKLHEEEVAALKCHIKAKDHLYQRRCEELDRKTQDILDLKCEISRLEFKLSGFPNDFRPFIDYYKENSKIRSENQLLNRQIEKMSREIENGYQKLEHKVKEFNSREQEVARKHAEQLEVLGKCLEESKNDNLSLKMSNEQNEIKIENYYNINKESDKQIDNLKDVIKVINEERERLYMRMESLERMLENGTNRDEVIDVIGREEKILIKELEAIGKAFESLQEQNSNMLKQMSSKDDMNLKLHSEKSKINMQYMKLKKEMDDKFQPNNKSNKIYSDEISRLENREKLLNGQIQESEKELSKRQNQIDYYRVKVRETSNSLSEYQSKLTHISNKNNELLKDNDKKQTEIYELENSRRKVEDELFIAKSKLESLSKIHSSSGDKLANEELEMYKQLIKCNTCNLRQKSIVLNKCMHVFCKECIDKRIETRRRKCPICGETFGLGEVRQLFL